EEPAYHIDLYDLNCIKNTQDDIVCDNNFIYLLINTPSAEACNWDSPDGEVLAAMLANGYNGNVDSYVGAATHRVELVIGHTVTKNLILSGHVFSPISHLKANLKIVDLECRTCF